MAPGRISWQENRDNKELAVIAFVGFTLLVLFESIIRPCRGICLMESDCDLERKLIMKRLVTLGVVIVLLFSCLAGCAQPGTGNKQGPSSSSKSGKSASTSGGTSTVADLSDDLFSFQFLADGHIYQLPLYYTDFTALGWKMVENGSNDGMSKRFLPGRRAIRSIWRKTALYYPCEW